MRCRGGKKKGGSKGSLRVKPDHEHSAKNGKKGVSLKSKSD